MPEEEKKDYRVILKHASKFWLTEYLYGYIQCLLTHGHINIEESMELVDYATELGLQKLRIKT